jgi:CrcB protein
MTSLTQKTHPNWRLFLVVGLLGGYTTFSTFAWETYISARNGSPWIGLFNVITSVILGYFAVWLGAISIAKR